MIQTTHTQETSRACTDLNIQLHAYQQQALAFIKQNPYSALFLDMGCGKTLITLTMLYDINPHGNVLIVAPINIARSTWFDEIKKWGFPFNTKSLIVDDAGKKLSRDKRLKAYAHVIEDAKNNHHAIYFINRELIPDLVNNCQPWPFPIVIIDESQSFKSPSSKRFKALKKVRPQIERLVELTGTPAPNGPLDLWSQINLLDQGRRLGTTITNYRDTYFYPTILVYGKPVSWRPKQGAEDVIYNSIKDIAMSLKNTNLALPKCTMNYINVYMDPDEKAKYDKLKQDSVLPVSTTDTAADTSYIIAQSAAILQIKLSQMASGTIYIDTDHNYINIHDKKLEQTDYILRNTDSPVIVAYHFRSDKERLMDYLTKAGHQPQIFDGSPDMVHAWNAGAIPVMLLQPASAAHGLNLQAGGHTLIWYTLSWSLEEYLQTNARIYRQGQTNPVMIHHLICADTIDPKIIRALKNKDTSQQALLEAVNQTLSPWEQGLREQNPYR